MEFVYGSVIGIAQTVIGHPLDTIKTHIQNNSTQKLSIPQYFRGVSYPILCSTICNSLIFPVHQKLSQELNHFHAGAITGAVTTPIIYITDTFKLQKQMQLPKNITQHAHITTLARETIATSLYFGVYHYLRDHDCCSCFHAGGIAGMASWWLTFPLDTLRNRQIVHNTTIRNAYRMGSVWSGVYFCLTRAYIVNGASFLIYDYLFDVEDVEG